MKKEAWVFLMSAFMMGCNGVVKINLSGSVNDSYFVVHSGFPAPFLYIASAVQWDNDYAVTVRHAPFVKDVVHTCSTGCDLVFINHKAKKDPLPWRAPLLGENITVVGFSPYLCTTIGNGKIYTTPFLNTKEGSGDLYGIHDAPLIKGMSGGPVIGSDNRVLGINTGFYSLTPDDTVIHASLRGAERVSIFIPYSIIEREWEIFQNNLNNKTSSM